MSRSRVAIYNAAQAPASRKVAATWVRKALRAYARAAKSGCFEALLEAEEHHHEALEHAALCGDEGRTVKLVEQQMSAAREKAWRAQKAQEID